LDNISRELLKIHLRLASVLLERDWSLIEQLTFNKATRLGEDCKTRQLQKFTRLHKTQHPTTKTTTDTVINLSDQKLEDGAVSLLQKGLNFAVTPRYTPIEDILTGVEKAVRSLPVETAEEATQETVRIMKNSPRPRDNLTRTESSTKQLKTEHQPHHPTSRQWQCYGDSQHYRLQTEDNFPS